MATALHSWLNQAQETTRYDSVAAKYGLVVDTPSGMSQTGQNALRFLRSLSEHSPTFFEGQARLLSPPTPDLVPSPHSPPPSVLATPMSGPQRPRRPSSRTPQFDDGLFMLEMPADDPVYIPAPAQSRASRARPYPALPRIHPDLVQSRSYFPPPPDPSPAVDLNMFNEWDKQYPQPQQYPQYDSAFASPQSYASSPSYPMNYMPQQQHQSQQQQMQPAPFSPSFAPPYSPPSEPDPTELSMHTGDDADRARMSALMYGSMRARAVVAATEADGQGW